MGSHAISNEAEGADGAEGANGAEGAEGELREPMDKVLDVYVEHEVA